MYVLENDRCLLWEFNLSRLNNKSFIFKSDEINEDRWPSAYQLFPCNRCVYEFTECVIMSCFIIKTISMMALIAIANTLFYILSFLHAGNPTFPKSLNEKVV
jgi:hypothetical protein